MDLKLVPKCTLSVRFSQPRNLPKSQNSDAAASAYAPEQIGNSNTKELGAVTGEAGLERVADLLGNMQVSMTADAECGAANSRGDARAADLQSLVDAWPQLSIEDRGAVLRLVKTSVMTPDTD